jgi:hypothetical protein
MSYRNIQAFNKKRTVKDISHVANPNYSSNLPDIPNSGGGGCITAQASLLHKRLVKGQD